MFSKDHPLVIGLTGSFGAGCSTVVEHLERQYDFTRFSLSELLRESARARGLGAFDGRLNKAEREQLQDLGDELRQRHGVGFLAEQCISRMKEKAACAIVVDSIRHPGEVETFRKAYPGFHLIAVYAPADIRFVRCRDCFGGSRDDFDKQDERDKGEGQPAHGQNVTGCVDQADVLVSNSTQFHQQAEGEWEEGLWSKIGEWIALIRNPGSLEPTYDELYMGQAYASSLMSTCCKRKVGAVIVRGLRPEQARKRGRPEKPARDGVGEHPLPSVVSTGWNEAPLGVRSCRDRGGKDKHGKPRVYCGKDQAIIAAMRAMSYCPNCREPLSIPDVVTTSFRCPNCNEAVIRKYTVGKQLDLCTAVHAEESAILQAARLGSTHLKGATLYTTTFPCFLCAKKIVQVGIEAVVFAEPYPMPEAEELLKEAEVERRQFVGVTPRSYFRLYSPNP